mgnify:CR=1 FL=1
MRYTGPYLQSRILRGISDQGEATVDQTTQQHISNDDNPWFLLGILLLEIGLGSPIERLREGKEDSNLVGDDYSIIKHCLVTNKLLKERWEVGEGYQQVARRCVARKSVQGMDTEESWKKVYSEIVAPLEEIYLMSGGDFEI